MIPDGVCFAAEIAEIAETDLLLRWMLDDFQNRQVSDG